MATITSDALYTPDDLLRLPDGDRFELDEGRLVERDMGALSSWVGGQVYRLIAAHGEDHKLGWSIAADCGYQCFPGAPLKVRKPDASFIRLGRLPNEQIPTGHVQLAPDLAAEVVSPNDTYEYLEEKVEDYLAAGVRLVWIVNPKTRSVHVYRLDGRVTRLRETEELDGEDVLPGFRCRVAELFPPALPPVAPPSIPG